MAFPHQRPLNFTVNARARENAARAEQDRIRHLRQGQSDMVDPYGGRGAPGPAGQRPAAKIATDEKSDKPDGLGKSPTNNSRA
jgi:hypothetical protein